MGGFSASPYLQDRAKSGLRTEAAAPHVVVMEEPYAAVLQGASVCTGRGAVAGPAGLSDHTHMAIMPCALSAHHYHTWAKEIQFG